MFMHGVVVWVGCGWVIEDKLCAVRVRWHVVERGICRSVKAGRGMLLLSADDCCCY